MLKPKKIKTERFQKKDFFSRKKPIRKQYLSFSSKIERVRSHFVNELFNVDLPEKNEIVFVTSNRQRSNVDFIPEGATNFVVFASRINEDSIAKFPKGSKLFLYSEIDKFKPEAIREAKEKHNVKLNSCHAKILMFIHNENHYIISGSGNPSINAKMEFYCLENNEEKYNAILKVFDDA